MIRRILVPSDFSDAAARALRYAAAIGQYMEVKEIHVVHIFTPQTAPDVVVIPPVEEMMEDRRSSLAEFVAAHASSIRIPVTTSLELGFAADEIVRVAQDYDLVVMGTTGEADFLERIFGSTSSAVAQRAHCPVLLVPVGASFKEYRHLLYASSDLAMSREAVLKLMEFNDLFNARIHFVHINMGEGDPYRGEREKLFASLFSSPQLEFAFEITELQADSVEEGIHAYLQEHPIDLGVMVTRERGFWESFFHRSQTKRIALSTEVPLLIFHLQ